MALSQRTILETSVWRKIYVSLLCQDTGASQTDLVVLNLQMPVAGKIRAMYCSAQSGQAGSDTTVELYDLTGSAAVIAATEFPVAGTLDLTTIASAYDGVNVAKGTRLQVRTNSGAGDDITTLGVTIEIEPQDPKM